MPSKPSTKPTGTTTGLHPHTAAALSYLLGWLTGLIFLLLEKDKFIRFHAFQSILIFAGFTLVQIFLGATVILAPLVPLIWILEFALWLVLIYKAYQGEKWLVPYVGEFAEKQVAKMK